MGTLRDSREASVTDRGGQSILAWAIRGSAAAGVLATMLGATACGPRPLPATAAVGASDCPPSGAVPADLGARDGRSKMPSTLRLRLEDSGKITVDGTSVNALSELGHPLERARAEGRLVAIETAPRASEAQLSELVTAVRKAGIRRVDLSFGPEPRPAGLAGVSSSAGSMMDAATVGLPPGKAGSLPELAIRTVGMHVGGGPNDSVTKGFFRQPLEDRFEDYRRCYLLVEEPGKGGTFGADLTVPRQGGKPQVDQPRSTFGGARFSACMLEAFSKAKFPKPPTGATKISYSLRFSLGET
jgi:hypothetical protein